jgi:hypothetical protein
VRPRHLCAVPLPAGANPGLTLLRPVAICNANKAPSPCAYPRMAGSLRMRHTKADTIANKKTAPTRCTIWIAVSASRLSGVPSAPRPSGRHSV